MVGGPALTEGFARSYVRTAEPRCKAVVGAPSDDGNGTGSGSAYVFRRVGSRWTQKHKLLPGDGAADDHFGYSVSVSGDIAVVGAYEHADASGSAYIFDLSAP